VAGYSGQFTPGGYLPTVIHTSDTTLANIDLPIVSPTRYQ